MLKIKKKLFFSSLKIKFGTNLVNLSFLIKKKYFYLLKNNLEKKILRPIFWIFRCLFYLFDLFF